MKTTKLILALTLGLSASLLFAQAKPPLSPPATASGEAAGASISVDYSAPSVRGRSIMGELVPWGKVWRAGANSATTLRTDRDVTLGSLRVPKGTYTLYMVPDRDEWLLIVSRQTGQWGTEYDASKDLGRIPMQVKKLKEPVETLRYEIRQTGQNSGALSLSWERLEASVQIGAAR